MFTVIRVFASAASEQMIADCWMLQIFCGTCACASNQKRGKLGANRLLDENFCQLKFVQIAGYWRIRSLVRLMPALLEYCLSDLLAWLNCARMLALSKNGCVSGPEYGSFSMPNVHHYKVFSSLSAVLPPVQGVY